MEIRVKVKKEALITTLVILIGLAVYNAIFFAVPFNFDKSGAAFWVTYGCTTFLILFMAVVVAFGLAGKDLKSKVFGFPILSLGYGVMVTQFVVDAVIMGVGHFFTIWGWIPAIIESLLFAFFFVSLIARVAYKGTIDKIDAQSIRESFVKELRIEVEMLVSIPKDENVKKELEKLNELVKYTDPISCREVEELEDEISQKVEQLKINLEGIDSTTSLNLISTLTQLIEERAIRVKNSH